MRHSLYWIAMVGGIWLAILSSESVDASTCASWPSCDESLPLNRSVDSALSAGGYRFDRESRHFALFVQTTSPSYGSIDPAHLATVAEQLECGYRYFVCQLGMPTPAAEKIQVYLGYHGSSAGTKPYIMLTDAMIGGAPFPDETRRTTPVHELFHFVQAHAYAYTSSTVISEGLATLGEQLVSTGNLLDSFSRPERRVAFSSPSYSSASSYGANVFFRYLFEQLYGLPGGHGELDEDWAVSDGLTTALALLAADPSVGPRDLVEQIVSRLTTPHSLATTTTALIDNYIVMRATQGTVDPWRQPQFAFFLAKPYLATVDLALGYGSLANALDVGETIRLTNCTTRYASYLPFDGFNSFLAAEYHQLLPRRGRVRQLRFSRALVDPGIRHQLIVRYSDGRVARTLLFEAAETETLTLVRRSQISEVIVVAYSVDNNPYYSGVGRQFDLSVEAL